MSGMRDHLFGCTCQHHIGREWNRPEHWSSREVGYLERHFGLLSDDRIAAHLDRTVLGVRIKARRLGLRKKDAGMTAREVGRLMGCNSSTVSKAWIARAGLHSVRATPSGPHRFHLVQPAELERFICERGWWIDWWKVPLDSPFYALVQQHRWYGKDRLHRATGRLTVDDDCRRGLVPSQRRGVHWYVAEANLPKIRALRPEHIEESVWRRQSVLRIRRERRHKAAAA